MFKGTLILTITKVYSLIFRFALGIYTAKMLGIELFGEFSYLMILSLVFSVVSAGGIDSVFTEHYANKLSITINFIYYHRYMAVGLLLYALLAGAYSGNIVFIGIMFISSIFLFWKYYENIFLFRQKYHLISITSLSSLSIAGLLRFTLLKHLPSVEFVAFTVLLENLLMLTIYQVIIGRDIINRSEKRSLQNIKLIAKRTFPVIGSAFAVFLYTKSDQFIIAEMLGKQHVGLYSVAVKLIESVLIVPVLISQLFYAENVNKNSEEFEYELKKTIKFYYVFSLVVILIIQILPYHILVNYLGSDYDNLPEVIKFLSLIILPAGAGVLASKWVAYFKFESLAMYGILISGLVNVLLNLWLVPLLGISGAVIATIISQLLTMLVIPLFWKGYRRQILIFLR